RHSVLERCLQMLRAYAAAAAAHGLVPTLENVPPVLRMRESRYLYTPIGMSPEDGVWLLDRTPGPQATLDVSHSQLYVTARAEAARGTESHEPAPEPAIEALYAYLRHLPTAPGVECFADALDGRLFEVHVSNAEGLLGEGLPYGEGDMDLD